MAHPLVVGLRLGLLAATSGGTHGESRGQVDIALDGGERHSDTRGWRAGGDLALTLWLGHRVIDDATPIAVQPFLQRASSLRMALGGAAFTRGPLGLDHDGFGFGVRASLAADVYLSDAFAVSARVGVAEDRVRIDPFDGAPSSAVPDTTHRSSLVVDGDLAFGYRLADLRVDLGLSIAPRRDLVTVADGTSQGGFALTAYPGGFLRLRTVLLEHIDIAATVRSLDHGAGADITIDYYPSHRLGLLSGIGGAHERLRPDLPTAFHCTLDAASTTTGCLGDSVALRVGFGFWASPRFALTALYQPAFYSPTITTFATVDNRVHVTLSTRF